MRAALLLSAAALLLAAACTPVAASGGGSGAANPNVVGDMQFASCWNDGVWIVNEGERPVTVRFDLSRYITPSGRQQAVSELDGRRYKQTGEFQKTLRIGSMQEAIVGFTNGDAVSFSERVGGWVYPSNGYLEVVVDTPAGRITRNTRGC